MKKTYFKPEIVSVALHTDNKLLIASGELLPTTLYDDETVDAGESLSRKAKLLKEEFDSWEEDF